MLSLLRVNKLPEKFPTKMDFFLLVFLASTASLLLLFLGHRRRKRPRESISTLIVLGSGGHTAEMLKMLAGLDKKRYSPRSYIVAAGDGLSEEKARGVEAPLSPVVHRVPRARHVGQSWLTTPFTTLCAAIASYGWVYAADPALILCNGPGTCVPIVLAAKLNNALGLSRTRVVFVESICRVKTLSLSARILGGVVDKLLVQWPELVNVHKNAAYLGPDL